MSLYRVAVLCWACAISRDVSKYVSFTVHISCSAHSTDRAEKDEEMNMAEAHRMHIIFAVIICMIVYFIKHVDVWRYTESETRNECAELRMTRSLLRARGASVCARVCVRVSYADVCASTFLIEATKMPNAYVPSSHILKIKRNLIAKIAWMLEMKYHCHTHRPTHAHTDHWDCITGTQTSIRIGKSRKLTLFISIVWWFWSSSGFGTADALCLCHSILSQTYLMHLFDYRILLHFPHFYFNLIFQCWLFFVF